MKGIDLFNTAVQMLGYSKDDADISKHGEICVKTVYSDLFYATKSGEFQPIEDINEDIPLDSRVLNDVMPYGIAAALAGLLSDGDKQQLFTQIYNRKRLSLSSVSSITDTLPVPE